MTPEQQKFLNSILANVGPQAMEAFPGLLQGYSEDTFQKGVVDPAKRAYSQDILPAIEQRFTDANAGSSSALNQALIQSSENLSDILAGQRINYQQMAGQQQLGALSQILGLLSQRSFDPIVQGPQAGLLKDLIAAGGTIGGAALMSSREVKDNIREYNKGLNVVREMNVKQYDYTVPVEGPQNDRVGLIAEELPQELRSMVGNVLAVDLYGLVSTLVNCVKELDQEVQKLRKNGCNTTQKLENCGEIPCQ